MKILVQRFMDDGYGKTHIIEDGQAPESMYSFIKDIRFLETYKKGMSK